MYVLSFKIDSDLDPSDLLDTLIECIDERFVGVDEETASVLYVRDVPGND